MKNNSAHGSVPITKRISFRSEDSRLSLGRFNGKEIEWRVLDVKGDTALVLSETMLLRQPYNYINEPITWERSSIRKWLNSSFATDCFLAEERKRICIVQNENENNPFNGTNGGIDTEDTIFLLSISEVNRYLPKYFDRSIGPRWWLRTPGDTSNRAMYIGSDGQRQYFGYDVVSDLGVRPAMWIVLK